MRNILKKNIQKLFCLICKNTNNSVQISNTGFKYILNALGLVTLVDRFPVSLFPKLYGHNTFNGGLVKRGCKPPYLHYIM